MSDDDDNTNLTPLSSSSSGPSGTRAWSVSVADAPENLKPDKEDITASETAQSSAAPMNDNERTEPVADAVELPMTEAHTDDTAEAFVAELHQNAEDQSPEHEPAEAEIAAFDAMDEQESESGLIDRYSGDGEEAVADQVAVEDAADEIPAEPVSAEPTTEELRQAVLETMAQQEEKQEEAFALFERISGDFSAMLASARKDAATFSFKLMEFAQANAQNNFELARAYSSARSLPEIFNVQADYVKRQLELLNAQARELQALTSELTAKNTMDIQNRHNAR